MNDTIPDNFDIYASDGIDDAWQMQYFEPNSPKTEPDLLPQRRYAVGIKNNLAAPPSN